MSIKTMTNTKLTTEEEVMISSIGKIFTEALTDKLLKKFEKMFPEQNAVVYMQQMMKNIQEHPETYFSDAMIDRAIGRYSSVAVRDLMKAFDHRFCAYTSDMYYTTIVVDFNHSREDLVEMLTSDEYNLTRQQVNEIANDLDQKMHLARSLGRHYIMPATKLDDTDIDHIVTHNKVPRFTKYTLYIDKAVVCYDTAIPVAKRLIDLSATTREIMELLPQYDYYAELAEKLYDAKDYYDMWKDQSEPVEGDYPSDDDVEALSDFMEAEGIGPQLSDFAEPGDLDPED